MYVYRIPRNITLQMCFNSGERRLRFSSGWGMCFGNSESSDLDRRLTFTSALLFVRQATWPNGHVAARGTQTFFRVSEFGKAVEILAEIVPGCGATSDTLRLVKSISYLESVFGQRTNPSLSSCTGRLLLINAHAAVNPLHLDVMSANHRLKTAGAALPSQGRGGRYTSTLRG
jgi:hypothetical protein